MTWIKETLQTYCDSKDLPDVRLPDVEVDIGSIRAVLINDTVADKEAGDFYDGDTGPARALIAHFNRAGIKVRTPKDLLFMGIYVTNALKVPGKKGTVEKSVLKSHAFLLNHELALFDNLEVIMVNGRLAISALNHITRELSGEKILPDEPIYLMRRKTIRYGDIRILPSYALTGANLAIDKSRLTMIRADIETLMRLLSKNP